MEYLRHAKEEWLTAGERFAFNAAQAMIMGAFSIAAIDALVYQLTENYIFGSLGNIEMGTFQIIVTIIVTLSLIAMWLLFFMKIYKSFIQWRCPGAQFEPLI